MIGLTLAAGGEVSAPIVGAIFLSNVPEALSSSVGLKEAGYPRRYIAGLWSGMAALAGIASGVGYAIADALSPEGEAFVQALAAGAILAMLADTMIPEAYRREFEEHRSALPVGSVTVLGFATAFLLSKFE